MCFKQSYSTKRSPCL